MKTIGVRALRENPGVLSQSAAAGEFILIANRNNPVSLAKAAALAKMPVERFADHHDITVADHSSAELKTDPGNIIIVANTGP